MRLVSPCAIPDAKHFNPRTREGCDSRSSCVLVIPFFISIHAPARGATSGGYAVSAELHISIHAPARGATAFQRHTQRKQKFQSTHPRGVRLSLDRFDPFLELFQSTHPRGVRLSTPPTQCPLLRFQSTHPRGVRLFPFDLPLFFISHFNPRTREGCDCLIMIISPKN